jgi:hypothetical protein
VNPLAIKILSYVAAAILVLVVILLLALATGGFSLTTVHTQW